MAPDDPKVVSESSGILEAIEFETLYGASKWSPILKRDEVQTGKRLLLAYGIRFMNQMGRINLVVKQVGARSSSSVITRSQFCAGTSVEKLTTSASVALFFLFMLIFERFCQLYSVGVFGPENILPLHVRAKGNRHLGKLALELFCGNDHPDSDREPCLERVSLIFVCLNMVFVPIVYFFSPETANLTLGEIDCLYTDCTGDLSLMSRAGDINMIGDGWGRRRGWKKRPDER
ncbi:hypothetical protein N7523_005977 [Penicillium sp. IBT 18751x]|nr:hypothetical protein N7523_005977 [Penicillium sp. IBT 18751x]